MMRINEKMDFILIIAEILRIRIANTNPILLSLLGCTILFKLTDNK